MAELYSNILKAQIGRVSAKAKSDNYFPVAGKDSIQIDAETKWGQTSEWQTQDGGGGTATTAGNLARQHDYKSVTILGEGELNQKFTARNYLTETVVSKVIYAMLPQVLPYFNVTATETVRVGDTGYIKITAENGYATSRNSSITARIYRENGTEPVKTVGFDTSRPGPTYWASSAFSFSGASDRGIYDVEVDVTDTLSGVTFTKRINKLITVTPKLCPKPSDTTQGYEVAATYYSWTSYDNGKLIPFELRLWRNVNGSGLNYAEAVMPRGDLEYAKYDNIPIHLLPAGTTLVLRLDGEETEAYPVRLFVTGNALSEKNSDNGTANFTFESPLVITHDRADVWEWGWKSYGALQIGNNCRNIVFDGYGYNNTGIHFQPFNAKVFANSCIFLVNGTSDWEMFGCDIDGAGFAGISAKTDPDKNRPWYWRESGWEMNNLHIHHCTFQNTMGEGVYIGYYTSEPISAVNSSGEEVTYHAHTLRGIRLYRCRFYHTYFDGIQINNSRDVEVCYNELSEIGYSRKGDQGSAFSCTFDGRVYNNYVHDIYGMVGILFPFSSRMEVFNNVFVAAKRAVCLMATAWMTGSHEFIDPDSDGIDDNIECAIYNNVIKGLSHMQFNTDIKFSGLTMNDNLIITERGITELPYSFTGSGNYYLEGEEDYDAIDLALKIADSANSNYQPNFNSPLIFAGQNGLSPFDFRGYKNWFDNIYHAGPFMGIYKSDTLPLILRSVMVNGGAESTDNSELSITYECEGTPTMYRVGEGAAPTGAWLPVPSGAISYALQDTGAGEKVIYLQLSDGKSQTGVLSASIRYSVPSGDYIRFADDAVESICVANWDTDGDGKISYAEAAAVESIGTVFARKTVTTFDEFKYFTGVTSLSNYAFEASSLQSVEFPPGITEIPTGCFKNCAQLSSVVLNEGITNIKNDGFYGCASLRHLPLPDTLAVIGNGAFINAGLIDIDTPARTVSFGTSAFSGATALQKVVVRGDAVFSMKVFQGCTGLQAVLLYSDTYIPWQGWLLDGVPGIVYVQDNLVSTYQAAGGWSGWTIKPISEYTE